MTVLAVAEAASAHRTEPTSGAVEVRAFRPLGQVAPNTELPLREQASAGRSTAHRRCSSSLAVPAEEEEAPMERCAALPAEEEEAQSS